MWISKLLYLRGSISTNKIWEEYQKDKTIEDPDMIRSKTFLKTNILDLMVYQGKIQKGPATDQLSGKRNGWEVVPHKAFKSVDPIILA